MIVNASFQSQRQQLLSTEKAVYESFEPGSRDLLPLSYESLNEVKHWQWGKRPSPQARWGQSFFLPRGIIGWNEKGLPQAAAMKLDTCYCWAYSCLVFPVFVYILASYLVHWELVTWYLINVSNFWVYFLVMKPTKYNNVSTSGGRQHFLQSVDCRHGCGEICSWCLQSISFIAGCPREMSENR